MVIKARHCATASTVDAAVCEASQHNKACLLLPLPPVCAPVSPQLEPVSNPSTSLHADAASGRQAAPAATP